MDNHIAKISRAGSFILVAAVLLVAAAVVLNVPSSFASSRGEDQCVAQHERGDKDRCKAEDSHEHGRCSDTSDPEHEHDGDCDDGHDEGSDSWNCEHEHDGDCDDGHDDGSDSWNCDSDHDGVSDGDERHDGSDPWDPDSDHDGVSDGDDLDPMGELESEIEGEVEALTCPTPGADGVVTISCIDITLTAETEYEGVENCEDLAARFAANGGAHVEVEVTGDLCDGFVAAEVELEDRDSDGIPDHIDDDACGSGGNTGGGNTGGGNTGGGNTGGGNTGGGNTGGGNTGGGNTGGGLF